MREIIFRGKRVDTNEIIYGSLIITCGECEISDMNTIDGARYDVIPESVGQYIRLKDMYGNSIFSGDILSGVRKGSNSDKVYTGFVEWKDEQAGWMIHCGKYIMEILSLAMHGDETGTHLSSFSVIGNIYQNPELLNN
jgi:uncharacterized phage protein (TIGR01671 family)